MIAAPTDKPVPAPAIVRRDDIDRPVAVTWHAAGVGPSTGGDRWVVAVDGSECSLRAVAVAKRLTRIDDGAEVEIVNVQPWLTKEAAQTELARRGWAVTTEARRMLDAASVRWRLHVVMGEAATQIIAMAAAPGTCGIVIGSRGQTAAQSLLLGSVADKVVHQAKVPVMIVH